VNIGNCSKSHGPTFQSKMANDEIGAGAAAVLLALTVFVDTPAS
jgi:hypothetical protein